MKYVQVDPVTGCWLWTSTISKRWGYGRFWNDGKQVHAHRIAYLLFKGEIPEGLDVDHTCHNADKSCAGGIVCQHRRCVNPDHLEACAGKENTQRGRRFNSLKTHCPKGHSYDSSNTQIVIVNGRTWRHCAACNRANSQRARDKSALRGSAAARLGEGRNSSDG